MINEEVLEIKKEETTNIVLEYLKKHILDTVDLKKIEKNTKIKINDNNYLVYKKLVDDVNLVFEVFRYSNIVDGRINLLEAIYKFEGIFHSDITTLLIKIEDDYYSNIHIYVPISVKTYDIVKKDLAKLIERIKKKEKRDVIDYSDHSLNKDIFKFIKNDTVVGKLTVPLYVKKKRLGLLLFYYLDYRLVRSRERER